MRARRTDANHRTIRQTLRDLGWFVFDTSRVGGGFPDLLVIRGDAIRLVEVKAGTGKLNQAQEDFRQVFPVAILRSVEDAVNLR